MEKIRHEIMVVGGGASGIMAAIAAKMAGADVAILEHTDKIGKKLLVTGNGRCNITNLLQKPEYYRGHNPEKAWDIITHFTEKDTMLFFKELGLLMKAKGNYVYPYSNQAYSVVNSLKAALRRFSIPIYYRTNLIKIEKKTQGFYGVTEKKHFYAEKVILATGSKAAEKTGSDGSGYALAKELGHTIVPVLPALVQVLVMEKEIERLAGVRMDGSITLYIEDKEKAFEKGEIQFTEYGISGIAVFQVSRFVSEAWDEGKAIRAELDLCLEMEEGELKSWIEEQQEKENSLLDILTGLVNDKLARKIALSEERMADRLVKKIKHFPITILGTKGFADCQVCMGGVPLTEVKGDTMESLIIDGLYFAGELLDVDGICGGYNLQWAWSSGWLAGASAAANAILQKGEGRKE